MRGTVKWFNTKKGYGFIEGDNGSGDFFVHFSQIKASGFKTLAGGERVDFVPKETEKGSSADMVSRISSPEN